MDREAETLLLQATRRVVDAELHADRIVHALAHELQEPLRSIVSFSRLLEKSLDSRLNGDERELLSHIVLSGKTAHDRLVALVNYQDIISKNVDLCEIDLSDHVMKLTTLFQRDSVDSLDFEVSPLPRVFAEATLLDTLLQEIVDNAVAFCGERRAVVSFRLDRRTATEVFVGICDNGVGVDEDECDGLCEIFRRGRSHAADSGKAGMGLAIARAIMGKFGGGIRIWPRPEGGTHVQLRFRTRLPAAISDQMIIVGGPP